MKILAIDPAKGCTGWAVVDADGGADGTLLHAGTIRIDEKAETHDWVYELMCEVEGLVCEHEPEYTVVELPFKDAKRGPKSTRSALTLPTYGIAVGAAIAAVMREPRIGVVLTVPVDVWAKGIPPGDDYKSGRVRAAAYVYNRTPESFGAKTVAGNVADAVLLARWVLLNMVRRAVA